MCAAFNHAFRQCVSGVSPPFDQYKKHNFDKVICSEDVDHGKTAPRLN